MNIVVTPNPGDVYKTHKGLYRMYVEMPNREELLCVNLSTGRAYTHTKDNGLVDARLEEFVFNICEVVTSNTTEGT
jgi:hypothetical protein